MTAPYDIDISAETAELLEIARVQLRETPENREKGFKELRELMKKNPDLTFPEDDAFLEVILRCCHWYPEGAIELLRRIAEFRKDNEKVVKTLNPANHKKAFTETDVVNVLIDKDHLGRRIIILKQGSNWNPDEVSTDEIFQLLYLIHVIAQLEKSAQINGVVVIMDFEGLSLKQVKGMGALSTKRLLTFIQDAMPIRLKEIHFVKQPFIFNMVWALIKPFVKDKLKKRMYFHGDNLSQLHNYIPVDKLPSNYGGTLPEINYSGKEWYPCVDKYKEQFDQWSTFGFK
ncbi:Alpha-tocopherol transfer protein-like [Pseudolycoriella hygida]|uniref:Alpha-tocopherol transfer protein-like n=1 Tax=Pseudolycoriella hygida TaxID=35572 RepID=A0A9Q0N290_9DIPT|nr:Alpha-tocopherol transfer protein-like [Pseudolycoriella hygida]